VQYRGSVYGECALAECGGEERRPDMNKAGACVGKPSVERQQGQWNGGEAAHCVRPDVCRENELICGHKEREEDMRLRSGVRATCKARAVAYTVQGTRAGCGRPRAQCTAPASASNRVGSRAGVEWMI
jgi:hypothetical protein